MRDVRIKIGTNPKKGLRNGVKDWSGFTGLTPIPTSLVLLLAHLEVLFIYTTT